MARGRKSGMVDLSVVMITYNHEKYIAKAIQSVLEQQTKYTFELLIGDDHSKDGTVEEIKKAVKNLNIDTSIFQREKNLGMINNEMDLFLRAKGKYIAILEGDDYWTDVCKIEKCLNWLQKHDTMCAVYHDCSVVDENDKVCAEHFWDSVERKYSVRDYNNYRLPGQTGTIVFRNVMKEVDLNILRNVRNLPGDRIMPLFFLHFGGIGYLKDTMSAYRCITKDGGETWSSQHMLDPEERYLNMAKGTLEAEEIGQQLGVRVHLQEVRSLNAAISLVTGVRYRKKNFIEIFWKISKISSNKILFWIEQLFFIPRCIIGHRKWIQLR